MCKLYLFTCKTCLHDAMHCNLHVPPIEWRQFICQKLTPWLKPRRNQCHLALVIWRIATQGQHSSHVMGWWQKPTLLGFPSITSVLSNKVMHCLFSIMNCFYFYFIFVSNRFVNNLQVCSLDDGHLGTQNKHSYLEK